MTDTGSQPPAPAPAPEPAGDDGFVAKVRDAVTDVLDDLLGSGALDVGEGGEGEPAGDKPLTAADIQRIAREEMTKAQSELASKARAKRAAAPAQAAPAAPATPAPPEPPKALTRWERFQKAMWGD